MLSAFGVDHGISKSFRKLGPKLALAEVGLAKKPVSMDTRILENYAHFRGRAGVPGPRSVEHRQMDKEAARAMVTAHGNRKVHKGIPKGLLRARNPYTRARLQAHNKGKLGFAGGRQAKDKARKIMQSFEEPRPGRKLP